MLRSVDPSCRRVGLVCAVLALLPAVGRAGSIDGERLKLIPARMKAFVDDGSISGAVSLVAYRGKVEALAWSRFKRNCKQALRSLAPPVR